MPLFDGSLTVHCPTIAPLARIPERHVADGDDIAPEITFNGAPDGTVELALVCHDPDAPLPYGFTHWTVYGIRPGTGRVDLAERGVREGPSGIGGRGWTGPQPPIGHGPHHYYFWLYALDRTVSGEPTREQFLVDYGDAVLEQARLVGVFER